LEIFGRNRITSAILNKKLKIRELNFTQQVRSKGV